MTLKERLRQVGAVAILAGILAIATGVRPSLPVPGYLLTMGLSVIVTLVGIGVLHVSGFDVGAWWRPTDTEPGHRVPVPGEALEERREPAIAARVRRRAVRTLAETGEYDHGEAKEAVDSRAWPDDRLAAAYLAGRGLSTEAIVSGDVTLVDRLLAYLRGEPLEERARRRAIEEVRRLRGES